MSIYLLKINPRLTLDYRKTLKTAHKLEQKPSQKKYFLTKIPLQKITYGNTLSKIAV
jgi:hypothetical protein